jgi:hypothetical protein
MNRDFPLRNIRKFTVRKCNTDRFKNSEINVTITSRYNEWNEWSLYFLRVILSVRKNNDGFKGAMNNDGFKGNGDSNPRKFCPKLKKNEWKHKIKQSQTQKTCTEVWMGKITPGLRWLVNGILINCWQTLFQVLVNFYENVMLHVAWKFKVV